ncbi:MAG: carotenoid oxygenase family protein, partial [Acidimicrobiales bacterium]
MALTDEDLAAAGAENQYLRGNFAPLRSEGHTTDLTVDGTIPDGLDGHLLRTTPNPAGPVGPGHHWFLGDGMTHGVQLRDGQAVDVGHALVEQDQIGSPRASEFQALLTVGRIE